MLSRNSKKSIPTAMPTAAGIKANLPRFEELCIAGIISDQTEAASITPDANPKRNFWSFWFISFFNRKTQAEPKVVPSSGINRPIIIFIILIYHNVNTEGQEKLRKTFLYILKTLSFTVLFKLSLIDYCFY